MVAGIKNPLIIDDDVDFRNLIKVFLGKSFPDATVHELDPLTAGMPGDDFVWADYDLLLLDYQLGNGNTGLDILKAFRRHPDFPPTIMLTAVGNEDLAVRAMKSGVYDYLRKESLDREGLKNAINDVIDEWRVEHERQAGVTESSRAFDKSAFYSHLETDSRADEPDHWRVLMTIELDGFAELGQQRGMIIRDNIVRHIAKHAFEVFNHPRFEPNLTRSSDSSVALLVSSPTDESTVELITEGLCEHLAAWPYLYKEESIQYTVSVGVVVLQQHGDSAEIGLERSFIACRQAAKQAGNSFHIYTAGDESMPVTGPAADKHADVANTAPEPAKESTVASVTGGVAPAPPEAGLDVEFASGPDAGAEPGPTSAPISAQAQAAAHRQMEQPDAGEPPASMPFIDARRAFDENRVLQYFQPVMPLYAPTDEDAPDYFSVCVRMVDTDGQMINASDVMTAVQASGISSQLDRWMLRETIGRLISESFTGQSKQIFFLKFSADSLGDPGFFSWLQGMMGNVADDRPGESIIIEIAAADFAAKKKQAEALITYLHQSYGFRFMLTELDDLDTFEAFVKPVKTSFVQVSHRFMHELAQIASADDGISLIDRVKATGKEFIVSHIENSDVLTTAIFDGADYVMGDFIGEPLGRLEEICKMESLEIT